MNISVHDNLLISYEVNCERREIRVHTELRDKGKPFERTDVIFTGVSAYQFWHDCFGNIIFDFEEIAPEIIYQDYRAQFEAGWRYGWPGEWGKTEDSARAYFREHNVRGYLLSSSLGMVGWVLSQKMEKVPGGGRVA